MELQSMDQLPVFPAYLIYAIILECSPNKALMRYCI